MGVLNVTPDSFSDGGRYLDVGAAVARAEEIEAEGADLLDLGGHLGLRAAPCSPDDETERHHEPVRKPRPPPAHPDGPPSRARASLEQRPLRR